VAEEGGAPRAPRLGRRRRAAPRAQARSVTLPLPFPCVPFLPRPDPAFCCRVFFHGRSEAMSRVLTCCLYSTRRESPVGSVSVSDFAEQIVHTVRRPLFYETEGKYRRICKRVSRTKSPRESTCAIRRLECARPPLEFPFSAIQLILAVSVLAAHCTLSDCSSGWLFSPQVLN